MQPRRLPIPEFVALMAVIFSMLAFSIDAMLPAMPEIAGELSPEAPNHAPLILSFFVFGMGAGTFFTGPLSDAYGRIRVISVGIAVYILGALLAWVAPTLETMLAARALQGLGAAAPRVVSVALIRDLYEGRRMAQITSFVMTVFMLIPALAPSIGTIFIYAFGWRSIFLAFVGLALIGGLWLNLRQPETLAPGDRRPLTADKLRQGLTGVLAHRLVVLYIVVLTLGFTQMFGLITSIQQIYDASFDLRESFPFWFMASALIAAGGTVLNSRLVMRVGMRKLAIRAYLAQTIFSAVLLAVFLTGHLGAAGRFWMFFAWSSSIFFMAGLTFGNLNALALQPVGHLAGMAASITAAFSMMVSVLLAAIISLAFDGTPVPVLAGAVVCSTLAYLLMLRTTEAPPSPHG